jgi:hypothetical protein
MHKLVLLLRAHPARELVGPIYRDRVVLGCDSRGLFDDDL